MWKTQSGILEIILDFFGEHFPDVQIGTDDFKSCLREVFNSYENNKGECVESKKKLIDTNHTVVGAAKENVPIEKAEEIGVLKITPQPVSLSAQSSSSNSAAKPDEAIPSPAALTDSKSDYFPCAFCGEIFPTHAAYELHASSHHSGESRSRTHHECDVCGRCFDNYLSFKRHRINHSLVKPYTCDLCTRSFTRNHDLQRHKANVHRIRSLFESDAVRILNRHMLLSCQRCRCNFPTRSILEEHMQLRKCAPRETPPGGSGNGVIGGSGPFLCERCGMTFEQSSHLSEHRRSMVCRGGPVRPPPNVTFPSESLGGHLSFVSDCMMKFPRPEEIVDSNWKMEMVEDSEEDQELSCEHCSATFRLETDLVEHRILEHTPIPGSKRRHSSERSPEVNVDDREEPVPKHLLTAFPISQPDDEDEHDEDGEEEATDLSMKGKVSETHRDESKLSDTDSNAADGKDVWVCVYCSHSFCNKATLDRHMRTHTGDKPFQCPVCVKRFTRKHDLERHRSNIHEGFRPYNCPICQKTFPLKKNLTKHLITTHRVSDTTSPSITM